jgi:hypothetical protein
LRTMELEDQPTALLRPAMVKRIVAGNRPRAVR